ncbi:hypothetical protein R6Q57_024464 [Mikania cordata]
MFNGVSMDSVFDAIYDQELGEVPGSSSRASKEDEPENIILGSIYPDPYVNYLYALKYTDSLGKEVTSLDTMIERPDDDVENSKYTYTASSKDLFAVRDDRSRVVFWMYDKEKQLYLVKRFNRKLEYFKRPQHFCSLPKIDLRSMNNVVFKNISEDNQADLFAKFLKDQCDKNFPTMKLAKGRRFTSKYILDPVTIRPWVYTKYPPPNKEKAIPIHMRTADNLLKDFQFWYFEEVTFEAVIVCDSDNYFILEPM